MAAGISPILRPRQPAISFNEAAAEWPRESEDRGFALHGVAGFNEAAAEWPRELISL